MLIRQHQTANPTWWENTQLEKSLSSSDIRHHHKIKIDTENMFDQPGYSADDKLGFRKIWTVIIFNKEDNMIVKGLLTSLHALWSEYYLSP